MRRILTEYYSFVYRTTGIKLLAYISGLIYIAIINFIIVNGLAMLLQGWISAAGLVLKLFSFPVYFATIFLFMGLTFWLTPTVQTVAKDAKKNSSYLTLLLFTSFGILLFCYMHFADSLFV